MAFILALGEVFVIIGYDAAFCWEVGFELELKC
jgi:hypothetical protein